MKMFLGRHKMIFGFICLVIIVGAGGAWKYKHKIKGKLKNEWQVKMASKMTEAVFHSSKLNKKLPYRLFEPKSTSSEQLKPIILLLQGAGGRGRDNVGQMTSGVGTFIGDEFQGIEAMYVLAPQCPTGMEWNNNPPSSAPFVNYNMQNISQSWRQQVIVELLQELIALHGIDTNRIYISGASMGGTGTWEMLYRFPDFFAAAVPLNGRSDPAVAEYIGLTPIWSFHGKNDQVAPVSNSIKMHEALKNSGFEHKFTQLDAGHGIERQSYTPELYRWLIRQKRER